MKSHEYFIDKCISLARKGALDVSPNPMVGCVIVNDGKIIGEGYHKEYGKNHAEVNAINSVKDKSILKLEKISLKFGRKIILDNLNLKLNNGQILGLLGPNGVGKSTIFNLITGLLSPDFGSIIINSKSFNDWFRTL